MPIVVITQESLQAFTHPGLDLQTGKIIELEAEPAPAQMELFREVDQQPPDQQGTGT